MRHSGDPRVVITGIGVVSPFGVGRERFWDHVSRGCSGTRPIADFDASPFACRVAAPVTGDSLDDVPELDGDDLWDPGYRADPKRYSRAALIGVIAAREAWKDAGDSRLYSVTREHRMVKRETAEQQNVEGDRVPPRERVITCEENGVGPGGDGQSRDEERAAKPNEETHVG